MRPCTGRSFVESKRPQPTGRLRCRVPSSCDTVLCVTGYRTVTFWRGFRRGIRAKTARMAQVARLRSARLRRRVQNRPCACEQHHRGTSTLGGKHFGRNRQRASALLFVLGRCSLRASCEAEENTTRASCSGCLRNVKRVSRDYFARANICYRSVPGPFSTFLATNLRCERKYSRRDPTSLLPQRGRVRRLRGPPRPQARRTAERHAHLCAARAITGPRRRNRLVTKAPVPLATCLRRARQR